MTALRTILPDKGSLALRLERARAAEQLPPVQLQRERARPAMMRVPSLRLCTARRRSRLKTAAVQLAMDRPAVGTRDMAARRVPRTAAAVVARVKAVRPEVQATMPQLGAAVRPVAQASTPQLGAAV